MRRRLESALQSKDLDPVNQLQSQSTSNPCLHRNMKAKAGPTLVRRDIETALEKLFDGRQPAVIIHAGSRMSDVDKNTLDDQASMSHLAPAPMTATRLIDGPVATIAGPASCSECSSGKKLRQRIRRVHAEPIILKDALQVIGRYSLNYVLYYDMSSRGRGPWLARNACICTYRI